jgi:hypothetical protein
MFHECCKAPATGAHRPDCKRLLLLSSQTSAARQLIVSVLWGENETRPSLEKPAPSPAATMT